MNETDPLMQQRDHAANLSPNAAPAEDDAARDGAPAAQQADPAADASAIPSPNSAQPAAPTDSPDADDPSPTPAQPEDDPSRSGVTDADVDAMLHEVKVAAGVIDEDNPVPEDGATGEDGTAEGAPSSGVSAPVSVTPQGVRATDAAAVQQVLAQSQATAYRSDEERRETLLRQQATERRGRKLSALIALVLVVALACFAGCTAWNVISSQRQEDARNAVRERVSVTVAVSIPATEGAAQGSMIPLTVRGTDLNGQPVDETRFVNWDGTGLTLLQGTFELSVAASPIASDGTLFSPPENTATVTVSAPAGSGAAADPETPVNANAPVDLTQQVSFSFGALDPASVTDDQINDAYTYASQGGASTENAMELRYAAQFKRDNAVTAQQEEKRQQEEAQKARYTVSSNPYSFELPEYWRGKVGVRQDGDTTAVYPLNDPEKRLCTLMVRPAEENNAGDIANSLIYATPLPDGRTLTVWAPRWGYIVARAQQDGSAEGQGYTDDGAQNLVDLQTGGGTTYAAEKADIEQNGDNAQSIFAVDDYLTSELVPTIELK